MRPLVNLLEKLSHHDGQPCVTIQVPFEIRSFKDHAKLDLKVRKAVEEAIKRLNNKGGEAAKKVSKRLARMKYSLKPESDSKTLLLLASPTLSEKVWLKRKAEPKVAVRKKFVVNELRKAVFAPKQDYWVLALSKGATRLLKLSDKKLIEINNKSFPAEFEEQFQYEKSGGPGVLYYDDESRVKEIRLHAYFRHIEHLLKPYLKKEALPIVLLGSKGHLADFVAVSGLNGIVAQTIQGNYDHHSISELKDLLNRRIKSV